MSIRHTARLRRNVALAVAAAALAAPLSTTALAAHAEPTTPQPVPVQIDFNGTPTVFKITLARSVSSWNAENVKRELVAANPDFAFIDATGFNSRTFYVVGPNLSVHNFQLDPRVSTVHRIGFASRDQGLTYEIQMSGWSWGSAEQGRIVSEGINRYQEETDGGIVLITHYKRIHNYVQPDFVHVFADGRIVTTGGAELADQLEADGYDQFVR